MSNQKTLSNDGMLWLIIISGLFIVGTVLTMIIQAHIPSNCWDKYKTEQQAILNCEKHNG
jgi:type II secretory pathway component PulL